MNVKEKLVDLKPCPFCGGLRMDAFWDELPAGVPRKTQIQADILRLRRELLALSRMLDE